jgi:hypothetical protein
MNCERKEENGLMHLVFRPCGSYSNQDVNILQSGDISALFILKLVVKSGGTGIN